MIIMVTIPDMNTDLISGKIEEESVKSKRPCRLAIGFN